MALTIDLQELEKLRSALPASAKKVNLQQLLVSVEAARREERFDDAQRLLQAALLMDADHAPTWALVGSVMDELGDVDTARTAYQRAINLAHDDRSSLALARLHASVGEWKEADALAAYLARESEDADIRSAASAISAQVAKRSGGAS